MIFLLFIIGWISAIVVNGLADNLPISESYANPSLFLPRCMYCDRTRKPRDWPALLSTLFHSGQCARCGAPRPLRDHIVEAILITGIPSLWMMGRDSAQNLLIDGLIVSCFLLFTIIDFEYRCVIGEAVIAASCIIILVGLSMGGNVWQAMIGGAITGVIIFYLLYLLGRFLAWLFRMGQGIEPLGLGDVFLAGIVGVATGWPAVLLAIILSIFIAGIFGLIILGLNLFRRRSIVDATMAYGPYLLISGIIVYFYAGPVLDRIIQILKYL
jgi:prepilin signal peptidase PulO-like enzyme (type II secretory pathway)